MHLALAADVVVMYLATSPDLFPTICAQLAAAGLNGDKVRVVLEKPLGHDLASAQEINRVVRSVFREEQAFRIDHYLGKPSVQNLMALRFGNALFEPLWRRESIANIQITLAESIGVGTRGDFYSGTGALRDMIQNHALQLLTMVAMEPEATIGTRRSYISATIFGVAFCNQVTSQNPRIVMSLKISGCGGATMALRLIAP